MLSRYMHIGTTSHHTHSGSDIDNGDINVDRIRNAIGDYGENVISGTGSAWVGEIGIKVYIQDTRPVLVNNRTLAMWEDTIAGKFYLMYKNGAGEEKLVELA